MKVADDCSPIPHLPWPPLCPCLLADPTGQLNSLLTNVSRKQLSGQMLNRDEALRTPGHKTLSVIGESGVHPEQTMRVIIDAYSKCVGHTWGEQT